MSLTLTKRLEYIIGWSLVVMVGLMPFHAFLSIWIGSLSHHESLVQSWKEALTLVLLICAATLVYLEPSRLKRLDRLTLASLTLFATVAIAVTLWRNPGVNAVLFALKTDFEFLVLFLVAIIGFPQRLVAKMSLVVLITAGVVSAIAVGLVTILPTETLTHFGYGASTIAPYAYVGAAHSLIRTPSTLGGPNQLGSFLILPICLLAGIAWRHRAWWQLPLGLLFAGALFVSYSRSAWIGAAFAVITTIIALTRSQRNAWRIASITTALSLLVGLWLGLTSAHNRTLQNYLYHATSDLTASANSTSQHDAALRNGLHIVATHPLGLGLGSAGPASFHTIAPLIPENYYLQLALETGVVGAAAFVVFTFGVGARLWRLRHRVHLAPETFGALIGLSVVGLFLHSWADSSTAFIFWIFAGAVIGNAGHVEAA